MSRYNNNWGSHDQLQELRKANMALHRELDEMKTRLESLRNLNEELTDELYLAREALRREMPDQK
jgi:regulator of replication initiation timing